MNWFASWRSAPAVLEPETVERIRGALDEISGTGSVEAVLAIPVLVSHSWHKELRKTNSFAGLKPMLRQLASIANKLDGKPWPMGLGPLDALFMKVKNGELVRSRALALASDPNLTWGLSANYVRRMSSTAEKLARTGEWRDGVLLGQLVLSAVDARRGRVAFEQEAMEFVASLHWLDVVARALCEVPDPRLFHDAVARGEKLAHIIHDPMGEYEPASMLMGLGIVYLDPYVGGRTNTEYEDQHRRWLARFRRESAAANVAWDEKNPAMPEPVEAVQKAVDHLERAGRHRSGIPMGFTRKAQLQALVWSRFLGRAPEVTEVERVGRDALGALQGGELQGLRAEVENLLRWHRRMQNQPVGEVDCSRLDQARALLDMPVSRMLRDTEADDVLVRCLQTASMIALRKPRLSFQLWNHVKELGLLQGSMDRQRFLEHGLHLIQQAFQPTGLISSQQALKEEFIRLGTAERRGHADHEYKVVALALSATEGDQEELGLKMLDAVAEADGAFARAQPELLGAARAGLLIGAGVNRYKGQDFPGAALFYLNSAVAFLDIDNPFAAMDAVERVADLAKQGPSQVVEAYIAGMRVIAPRLESSFPSAAENLQRIHREMLARLIDSGEMKLFAFLLFLSVAKGAKFSQGLLDAGQKSWLRSEEARAMESRIAMVAAQCPSQAELVSEDFPFEWILTSYTNREEQVGGDTPAEQLRNLRISFEHALADAQRGKDRHREWIATDDELQNALGPMSALLAIYLGQLANGDTAIFQLLISSDSFHFAHGYMADWNANSVVMKNGDNKISLMPFSFAVAELLRSIGDDPLTRDVSAEAAHRLLLAERNMLGGGIKEKLEELRLTGRDHLYVWPHGPFHFAPFHLFGDEKTPLAQEWTVTYLSSLNMLDPERHQDVPREPFIAIGVDFHERNGRGLPPLVDSEAEALDVTRVMNAPHALTGPLVSKEAVLEALQTHRRLHIATHGDLPISAPSFQTLYLSSEPHGDVLHAYEIRRLDLRGVDLVTLSACQTALGRFDIGDNLNGFVASLFAAGVSTVIGTLWPVETQCARFFFVRLYSAVAAGLSKGEAFRQAQVRTRRRFPKHRDWGAFYLSGDAGLPD